MLPLTRFIIAAAFLAATLCCANSNAITIRQEVLQKGIYTFDDSDTDGMCASERGECAENVNSFPEDSEWKAYYSAVCAKENTHKCICEADVSYPVLEGDDISPTANQIVKQVAEGYTCKPDITMSRLRYDIPYHTEHIMSIVFNGYSLGRGGNGSCHSQIKTITINLQTGHVYALDELLDKSRSSEIYDTITDYVANNYIVPEESDRLKADTRNADATLIAEFTKESKERSQNERDRLRKNLDKKLWTLDFYIKDRQIFVDLNDYIMGCARGPSFPVPIPRKYIINNDILSLLR